jgi:hypothetical protein
MVAAFTTAAVINFSMARPEEGASPLDYMPSHRAYKSAAAEQTEEELERESDWNIRVMQRAGEIRAAAKAREKTGNG